MTVVDASVAVKWINEEPDSPLAERVLARSRDLSAPELLQTEVAAAITKQVRRRIMTVDQARVLCDRWFSFIGAGTVHLSPHGLDLHHAVELSLSLDHPYHDCLYLAAAMRLDAPLISADATLIAKARSVHPRAVLLRDVARG